MRPNPFPIYINPRSDERRIGDANTPLRTSSILNV
jgi:hypothetical protein